MHSIYMLDPDKWYESSFLCNSPENKREDQRILIRNIQRANELNKCIGWRTKSHIYNNTFMWKVAHPIGIVKAFKRFSQAMHYMWVLQRIPRLSPEDAYVLVTGAKELEDWRREMANESRSQGSIITPERSFLKFRG